MHQGHKTQIEKYGGPEGYRKEMQRRRSLRNDKSILSEKRLRALLKSGLTQVKIGRKVGLSKTQVYRLVKKYGIRTND